MYRCLIFVLLFLSPLLGICQSYPPLSTLDIPKSFVSNLSHTAYLLTPDPAKPQKEIRVLVYGQSISMQKWWEAVRQHLQERFPETKLIMENRAIGGFSSERLKLMVANDVVPFYPDLVLFHDYGNEADYEQIIRVIRSQTTAEVAVQTDHMGVGQNDEWHDRHCNEWLPKLCETYGLALLDVRTAWKAYLQQHQLSPKALLSDNVHLNDHGNYLMAQIINRYFDALPKRVQDTDSPIQLLIKGHGLTITANKVQVPVTGNRIDIRWQDKAGTSEPVEVLLDGKRPSTLLATYYYTRPSLRPNTFFLTHIGQLLAIQLNGTPQAEDWTLIVTAVDSVNQQLNFKLEGSKTGADGEGSSESNFVSRSGRIQISPADWFRRKSAGDFRQFYWLKPGDQLRWQVRTTSADQIKPANGITTTLVQGIPNDSHVLELTGKGVQVIQEIRVYKPPLNQ
jgi:hypothetical protein